MFIHLKLSQILSLRHDSVPPLICVSTVAVSRICRFLFSVTRLVQFITQAKTTQDVNEEGANFWEGGTEMHAGPLASQPAAEEYLTASNSYFHLFLNRYN